MDTSEPIQINLENDSKQTTDSIVKKKEASELEAFASEKDTQEREKNERKKEVKSEVTIAKHPKKNIIHNLIKSVMDAYKGIRFDHQHSYYLSRTITTINSSLMEFRESLAKLMAACETDEELIEEAAENELIFRIITVTNVKHGDYQCDIQCLDFIALLATTKKGAEILESRHMESINFWVSFYNKSFSTRAKPISINIEKTLALIEAKSELLAKNNGKESLASLGLENSSIGILLTTRGSILRRVRALPQLYKDLPREKFCSIFPKGCSGCIAMNLICASQVLGDPYLVWTVVKEILNDPTGEILTCEELMFLGKESKYLFKHDSYPSSGNCISFGFESPLVRKAHALGDLIASQYFSEAMKKDHSKCIAFVKNKPTILEIDEFCKSVL